MSSKAWREANPERYRITSAARALRNAHTPKGKFRRQRATAKSRGIPMDLSFDEFMEITKDNECHWCGGPLPKTRPGLDRIDNSEGYTLINCLPCCRICNWMKGEKTPDEFLLHIKRIYERNFR